MFLKSWAGRGHQLWPDTHDVTHTRKKTKMPFLPLNLMLLNRIMLFVLFRSHKLVNFELRVLVAKELK